MVKSYTNIEQSKRLAEILPIESADMSYSTWTILESGEFIVSPNQGNTIENLRKDYGNQIIPCWSLAALIELIPDECRMEKTPLDQTGEFTYSFVDDYYNIRTFEEDNAVDAAVEMILKLKEKDLL